MQAFARSLRRRQSPATVVSTTLRHAVRPPSLRQAPQSRWLRALDWLLIADERPAAPPPNRLFAVRAEFDRALADVPRADDLRERIASTHSLRDLWHLRADVYQQVGLAHDQCTADARLASLNRHFPAPAATSRSP